MFITARILVKTDFAKRVKGGLMVDFLKDLIGSRFRISDGSGSAPPTGWGGL